MCTATIKGKSKNFSEEEEMQLCRSYLAVVKDAKIGTNQNSNTFWERITVHFQGARPADAEHRQYRSLKCK